MKNLPVGVEAGFRIYFTDPEKGIQMSVDIFGVKFDTYGVADLKVDDLLGLLREDAPNIRLMTADEIVAYKADQRLNPDDHESIIVQ